MTADESSPAFRRRIERIPAVWLVIGGILSLQFGAAIAKNLFDVVPPTAMVWMRLVTSAVVFMIIARPRIRGRSRSDFQIAVAFGRTLAITKRNETKRNWAIYH